MGKFQYEYWIIKVKETVGVINYEIKARSKDNAIKQIKKEIAFRQSEKNLTADIWHRQPQIIEIYWDTLTLDRTGRDRRY